MVSLHDGVSSPCDMISSSRISDLAGFRGVYRLMGDMIVSLRLVLTD